MPAERRSTARRGIDNVTHAGTLDTLDAAAIADTDIVDRSIKRSH